MRSVPMEGTRKRVRIPGTAFLSLSILPALHSFSQTTVQDSLLVFKVRNPVSEYTLIPNDSVLASEKKTNIKIRSSSKEKPFKVTMEGARIKRADSIFSIYPDSSQAALLTILEYQKNKWRPVKTKLYKIKHPPEPVVIVCGVKADSVIDKQQLIQEDKVAVYAAQYKSYLPVKGFELIYVNGDSMDTLKSANSHFTLDMRRRIHLLKPGDLIYFEKVRCQLPDGKLKTMRAIQIFIDETNKFKVGYRTPGK